MLFRDLYRINYDWTKKTKLDVRYINIEEKGQHLKDISIGDIPGFFFDMRVSCFGSDYVVLERA